MVLLPCSSLGAEFDTVAYCKQVSATVGGSYVIEKGCRDQEAEAKAALAARDVPPEILAYCTKVAETIGGSYQILQGCVEQEIEAKKALQD